MANFPTSPSTGDYLETSGSIYKYNGVAWQVASPDAEIKFATHQKGATEPVLYLQMSGSNDSTTFTDSSKNNLTVTSAGGAKTSTSQKISNLSSAYFDGSDDSLLVPYDDDLDLGSGDFTVEMWYMPVASVTGTYVFSLNWEDDSGSNYSQVSIEATNYYQAGKMRVNGGTHDGSAKYTDYSTDLDLNTWNHIAVVRSGDTFTCYVNGVANTGAQTLSGALTNNSKGVYLGRRARSDSPKYANCYLDEVKIFKGYAKYTSNFTPSSTLHASESSKFRARQAVPTEETGNITALTIMSGSTTSSTSEVVTKYRDDENTTLLLDADYHYDESDYANSVTFNGDLDVVRRGYYFDGSGDSISVPTSTDFDFGTDAFTIEFWFNTAATNSFDRFITFGSNSDERYWTVAYQPSGQKYEFVVYNGGSWQSTGRLLQADASDLTANNWHHLALVRESGDTDPKLYINGVEKSFSIHSDSQSMPSLSFSTYSSAVMKIGAWSSGDDFSGYMSDIQVSKGVARYTASFDHVHLNTDYTGTPKDSYHKLILNGAGDESDSSHSLTFNGNALKTVPHTGHQGSFYFDGSGDYISLSNSDNFDLSSEDFTFEAWVYPTDSTDSAIFHFGNTYGSNQGLALTYWKSGSENPRFRLYVNDSQITACTSDQFAPNNWYHVALVKDSGNFRIYVNGVAQGSATSATHTHNSTNLNIGYYNNIYYFSGYMTDVRLSKGVARYTSAFSNPTAPLEKEDLATKLLLNTNSNLHDFNINRTNNSVLTFVGDTKVVRGYYFDGNGDWLSLADHDDFDLGSDDFTIECWIYPKNIGSYNRHFFSKAWLSAQGGNHNYTYRSFSGHILTDGKAGFQWYYGSSYTAVNGTTVLSNNTWYHYAVVKTEGTVSLYINGNLEASASTTDTINATTAELHIGSAFWSTNSGGNWNSGYKGYIDEFRISKAARYTSDFSSLVTTKDSNHKLILDGISTDSSDSGHSLSFNGNATVVSQFGNGAIFFDGTDDAIYYPNDDSTWNLRLDNEQTYEGWFFPNSTSGLIFGYGTYYGGGGNDEFGWMVRMISGNLQFLGLRLSPYEYLPRGSEIITGASATNYGGVKGTTTVSTNEWHHVALVADNGTFEIYLDGELEIKFTLNDAPRVGNANTRFTLGAQYSNGNYNTDYQGYIDDFRVSNVARYSSTFTPHTSVHSLTKMHSQTGGETTYSTTGVSEVSAEGPETKFYIVDDGADSDTKLLLHFDGTDEDTTTTDSSAGSHSITMTGAKIDNGASVFGTTSALFDGTNDYITVADHDDLDLGDGSFTIEFWMNRTDTNSNNGILFKGNRSSGTAGYGWLLGDDNFGWFYYGNGTITYKDFSSITCENGVWQHVALVYDGSSLKLYVNGDLKKTESVSNIDTGNVSQDLEIGNATNYGGGAWQNNNFYFSGYIDDLRLSKGVARYTSNFDVPTVAHGSPKLKVKDGSGTYTIKLKEVK